MYMLMGRFMARANCWMDSGMSSTRPVLRTYITKYDRACLYCPPDSFLSSTEERK